MRPGAHVLFHGWAKGIAPDEKRLASELQIGHERQGELRGRQRPSPGSIKTPGGEPLESDCHPVLERCVERTPVIRQTPFVDAARVAAIQHIDAYGQKALTTRRNQPRHALLRLDLPLRVRRRRELGTGLDMTSIRANEQHNCQQTKGEQAYEKWHNHVRIRIYVASPL